MRYVAYKTRSVRYPLLHSVCFDQIGKNGGARPGVDTMSTIWPKGQACGYCGGKTRAARDVEAARHEKLWQDVARDIQKLRIGQSVRVDGIKPRERYQEFATDIVAEIQKIPGPRYRLTVSSSHALPSALGPRVTSDHRKVDAVMADLRYIEKHSQLPQA